MAEQDEILEAAAIVTRCKLILQGKPPEVQFAALAELVALWLVGNPDFVREPLFENWVELVRNLVEPVEGETYKGGGHPQNKGLEKAGMA